METMSGSITDCETSNGANACVHAYTTYVKKHYPNIADCLRFVAVMRGRHLMNNKGEYCFYSVKCFWKARSSDEDLICFKLKYDNLNNFVWMVGTEIEEEAHGY